MNRPHAVEKAVTLSYWLLAIYTGLALLQFPFDPRMSKHPSAFPILLLMLMVTGGLTLFLISKVKQQRNWARITLLVILCISLPGMLKSIIEALRIIPVFGIMYLGLVIAEVYCMVLLFGASANRWFSEYRKDANIPKYSLAEQEGRGRMMGIYEKEEWRNK